MPSLKYLITLLSISIPSLRLVNSHLLPLPNCVQECIEQSPDIKCSSDDIPCLCVSTENVLSSIISCIQTTCTNHLDTTTLLTPLQLACQLAGHPIPISSVQTPSGTIIITTIPTQTFLPPLSTGTLTTTPDPSSPKTTATTQASTLYPYLGTRPSSQAIGASTSSSAVTQLSGTRSSTGTGTGTGTGGDVGATVGSRTSTSTSPNSAETNGSPFQDGSSSLASCRGRGGWMFGMGIVYLFGNFLL